MSEGTRTAGGWTPRRSTEKGTPRALGVKVSSAASLDSLPFQGVSDTGVRHRRTWVDREVLMSGRVPLSLETDPTCVKRRHAPRVRRTTPEILPRSTTSWTGFGYTGRGHRRPLTQRTGREGR